MKTKFIYALRCPVTDEVRYVGASVHPWERHQHHFTTGVGMRRSAWIRALRTVDERPELIILDYCKPDESSKLENDWIHYFQSIGCDLVNAIYKGYDRAKMLAEASDRQRVTRIEFERLSPHYNDLIDGSG